jgi:hypothetical protein
MPWPIREIGRPSGQTDQAPVQRLSTKAATRAAWVFWSTPSPNSINGPPGTIGRG